MESKAENLSCNHSTARFFNAVIRKKVRAQDARFSCAESILEAPLNLHVRRLSIIAETPNVEQVQRMRLPQTKSPHACHSL